jgi:hypothetical protein
MLISEQLSVPTVNGYTAHDPPGWRLANPERPGYLAEVAAWASSHGVRSGLCELDLGTMRWLASPPLPGR